MDKNELILNKRTKEYNKYKGARVGDFLIYKKQFLRFSHDWKDSLQVSKSGSFYLGDGYISFSGSLNPGIDKKYLINTGKYKKGSVWFFDLNISGAGRGKTFFIPLRVYKIKKGTKINPYDILGHDLCPICKSSFYELKDTLNFKYKCLKCKHEEK